LISFGLGSALVRYYTKFRAEGDKDGEENMYGLFNIIFFIIMLITNPATAKPMEAKPSTKTSRLINGAITVLIIFKICKKTNFSWLVTTEVQGEDKKDIAVENYYTKFRAEGDKDGEENMYGLFNIIFFIIACVTIPNKFSINGV